MSPYTSSSPSSSTKSWNMSSYDPHMPPFTTSSPVFGASQVASPCKLRYDASRSFEVDDDNEFCPALAPYSRTQPQRAWGAYLPTSVPVPVAAAMPVPTYTPPRTPSATQRPRKAVDIIDPVTGARVTSPRPRR